MSYRPVRVIHLVPSVEFEAIVCKTLPKYIRDAGQITLATATSLLDACETDIVMFHLYEEGPAERGKQKKQITMLVVRNSTAELERLLTILDVEHNQNDSKFSTLRVEQFVEYAALNKQLNG
jgi:hypothetical protein